MDDPIVNGQRVADAPRSKWVQHLALPQGGHLGFLAINPNGRGPRRWISEAVDHYLALARAGEFLGIQTDVASSDDLAVQT